MIDEDAIKNEVSRIFGEAEQPAAHFEFEKEDVEMIEPIESQHVTEDEKELYLLHRSSNLSDALLGNEKSHVENGQYTEGSKQPTELEKLRQAVADAPEDNAVRYRFAAELAQQNHVAQATEQLETILDYDRTNVDAYVLLAYLAEQQGDYMLSLNSLEKVALLKPDYTGIYYKLGRLTNEHFKRQNRKAYRYFQDAVAQDPTNADARYRFGVMSLEQNGDFKAAIAHFEAAAEAAPNHEGVVFELAKAHFEIGNRAEAARWYARATALNDKFKTESNDLLFHYKEPKPEPEPQPNDNGTTVLITGATSGIGRATAELFAKNGFRTILTGRRADRLEDLKTHFETEYRNRVQLLNFDVRSLADVKNALETLEDDFKNVDILINNAGLASGMAPIHEGDIEDWERMIDTNIKGLLYMTRAIAPHMVARRKGHIINLSSIAGKEIYPNGNVYCASKHAVDALTRAMRVDLHKYNIRVSQVTPGAVEETEFAIVRFHGDAERAKIYEDFTPLKASDVAETIYFIVTRPEYVNLQDITMMSTQQASANHFDRSGRMVNG